MRYEGPGSGQIGFDDATVSSYAPTNGRAFVLSLIDATDEALGSALRFFDLDGDDDLYLISGEDTCTLLAKRNGKNGTD